MLGNWWENNGFDFLMTNWWSLMIGVGKCPNSWGFVEHHLKRYLLKMISIVRWCLIWTFTNPCWIGKIMGTWWFKALELDLDPIGFAWSDMWSSHRLEKHVSCVAQLSSLTIIPKNHCLTTFSKNSHTDIFITNGTLLVLGIWVAICWYLAMSGSPKITRFLTRAPARRASFHRRAVDLDLMPSLKKVRRAEGQWSSSNPDDRSGADCWTNIKLKRMT